MWNASLKGRGGWGGEWEKPYWYSKPEGRDWRTKNDVQRARKLKGHNVKWGEPFFHGSKMPMTAGERKAPKEIPLLRGAKIRKKAQCRRVGGYSSLPRRQTGQIRQKT